MSAFSPARFFAERATSFSRLSWRLIRASFAMAGSACRKSVAERELELRQQRLALGVGRGTGRDRDVHPADLVDLVVLDLGEDDLLLDAHVVVALAVEALAGHAAEVAHARQRDRDQPVQELEHAVVAQRHHRADRVALADLEPGDRLARLGDDRLLPGDLLHVADGVVEQLLVGDRLAHAHVEDDLLDARHLHHRLVFELLDQRRDDFLPVLCLEASRLWLAARLLRRRCVIGRFWLCRRPFGLWLCRRLFGLWLCRRLFGLWLSRTLFGRLWLSRRFFHRYAPICSPLPLKNRTLRPSSSVRKPMRSALPVTGF